ncbi:All-trans-phytoene synthase [Rubripirellula obstinata]|uniref:All-trans-phytoene synthase n=1 Tax=Rubripirellula obstinata TaxID=406547 RepID=A0A5B1CJ89_9BACT|nr:squalene synthase HpnC [Rubripirellula obstinata]KAA1260331.1 All-trans-phytoene synthase [Rubripirellula obstinata]
MKKKAELVEGLTTQLASVRHAESLTRALAGMHYENFLVASVLLPRRLRQPFFNVYAYCRIADDLADESSSPSVATERLQTLRQHFDAAIAGSPTSNLFLALTKTMQEFDLPPDPFHHLLDAFEQDQIKTRYQDFDELLHYCQRSANPVGRIVLKLADCCNEETESLSDDICTGLQLANHWQDVGRDFAIGRIYLPMDRWDEFGVDESMFGTPGEAAQLSTPMPLRRMIEAQCDLAQQYLDRGLSLADRVPKWIAADIKLFAHGGLQTLAAIRKVDYDVLAVRPKVSKTVQIKLIAKAMLRLL